jgi:ketosteroid isomerase-like protein
LRLATLAIAFLMANLTASGAAKAEDMSSAVQDMYAAWDSAFNAGNAGEVAAMYATDGKVIAGDGTVKTGRADIEALFQSFIDSGFGQHELSLDSASGTSDLIYASGSWSGVGGDGQTYGGKVVHVYEMQDDGSWKAVLHMWN